MKEIKVDKNVLLEMYETMVRIRKFEDRVYYLFLEGSMPGTIHLYIGQEAVAAGACANLTREDVITSTHRPHGHAIAKGVSIRSLMAELFAKQTGCCKGKGGSMHVGDISVGAIPAIAIVAGGIPVATGCALAFKMKKKKQVAVSFFGDGASNEGVFHEAVNMGAIWNLPVIYVCENNLYGASTHVSKVMKISNIAERAAAYGIPGEVVEGNDMQAVYQTVRKAVEQARSGEGPTLVECKTYRRAGHSRRDANAYRDKEEEKRWLARDPLVIAKNYLLKQKIWSEEEDKALSARIDAEIEDAVEYAKNSPLPKTEDMFKNVWVEESSI